MDMELEFTFRKSAFKHGVTEADIKWAFSTARYDLPVEGDEEKRLLIGFDYAGNPVEIMYNELDDGRINVFHAMPCRSIYLPLLNWRNQ
jgi:hypothetical protein